MAQELTTTQKTLLKALPAELPDAELQRLFELLEAYLAKVTKTQVGVVEEDAANYSSANATEDVVHFSIPRTWLDDAWLAKLLSWIETKKLADRNKMTGEQAMEMGDEIKYDWWAKNQDWVLAKIGQK